MTNADSDRNETLLHSYRNTLYAFEPTNSILKCVRHNTQSHTVTPALTFRRPLPTLCRMAKPVLGRGLGALLGGTALALRPVPVTTSTANQTDPPLSPESRDGIRRVGLEQVRPCPFQPRKEFAPAALQELADSIREQGIIQQIGRAHV